MSVRTYSLSNNFNGQILPVELKKQIIEETGITVVCLSVAVDEGLVNITFDGILSDNEKKMLDDVVNNHHIAFSDISYDNDNIYIITNPIRVKSKSFTEVASFRYSGLMSGGISIIARGTDYTIRLFDLTNKLVMYEQDFSNKRYEEINVSNTFISNVPISKSLLAVQMKVNDKSKALIKMFQINT